MKENFYELKGLRFMMIVFAIILNFAGLTNALAQGSTEHLVKGRILDENGVTIPGATVIIDKTNSGTVSDVDGNYNLIIPNATGQTLTIIASYVGYKTLTNTVVASAGMSTTVDFSMASDSRSLDEIVVTGSTIRSAKRELGNNISTVNADALSKSGSNN